MNFKRFGISQNPHLKIFAEKLICYQSVYSDMFGLSRGVPGLSLFLHAAIPELSAGPKLPCTDCSKITCKRFSSE